MAHGVRRNRNAYCYVIKCAQGMGPMFPPRLNSLGVKVQSRIKISRTNLQAIGVRGQFTKLGKGKPRQGSQKEQMLEAGNILRKTVGQTQVAMAKPGAQVNQITLSDCGFQVRIPWATSGWWVDGPHSGLQAELIHHCALWVFFFMTLLAKQPPCTSFSAPPQDPVIRSNFVEPFKIYTNKYFSKLYISIEHSFFLIFCQQLSMWH